MYLSEKARHLQKVSGFFAQVHITAPSEAVLVDIQPVAAPRTATELAEADIARPLLDTSLAVVADTLAHRIDIPAGMAGIVVDTAGSTDAADCMVGNMVYLAAVAAGNRFVTWAVY
jgi:hypothetical protein